ncbi:Trm112 family protein [Thioalkalivibrio sp. HK1]|uniref:Trm112 family protein n=1 Tax=Thioalkalivibrio sp. HK1 TaxID=1469245 RepID=UPI001E4120E9|nr:Trm112 family protein [Thioalkalivibrio sp. HK1]
MPAIDVDPKLLEILVCPLTTVSVRALDETRLLRLNQAISRKEIRYHDGSTVEVPLEEALTTGDGRIVYRVDDGIPIMLIERAIPTEHLENWW